jgi:hypothetical protein
MTAPDTIRSRSYLKWFLFGTVACAALIAGVNALVDPLNVSPIGLSIPGLNTLKPVRPHHDRVVKPYDVWSTRPRTIFIGASTVKQSIDPSRVEASGFAPAYNGGIDNGADFEEIRRFVRYYLEVDPELKFLRIEVFLPGLTTWSQPPVRQPPITDFQVAKDWIAALFSASAVGFSIETIFQNRITKPQAAPPTRNGFSPIPSSDSHVSVWNLPDMLYRKSVFRPELVANRQLFNTAQDIIEECRAHNVDCRFFFSPLHADALYGIYFMGLWNEICELKKSFARIAPTYDFTRYNDLIDERTGAIVYWPEGFHFSPALGNKLASVMTDQRSADLPPNFGILMDAGTVDADIAAWTAERDAWIQRHPLIAARYEAARFNVSEAVPRRGKLDSASQSIAIDRVYMIREGAAGSVEWSSPETALALGWVGDVEKGRAALAVAVFADSDLIAYAKPNYPRPDLAKDSRDPLSIGGFLMPVGSGKRGERENWRAFALFEDRTAVELTYAAAAGGFVRTDVAKK